MAGGAQDGPMTAEVLLVAAASLVVTAAGVPACIALAHRWNIMDRPGQLKVQRTPVPYLGGVAVFAGAAIGLSKGRPIALVPVAVALAVGVGDDRLDLPAPARLAAQLGIGAIIAVIEPVHLAGWVAVPLVMAATVVLINGFNLLDGLDMLAAGVAGGAAIGFAILTTGPDRLIAVSLMGALVGFLLYNRPPARIYLGDGGSYLIGASVTVLLVGAWGVGTPTTTGVLGLALLAVPVAEVSCAIVRRRRGDQPLLSGDRSHPYDLLVARGWSRTAASVTYIGVELVVVGVVGALHNVSVAAALGLDVAIATAVVAGAAVVGGLRAAGTSA
jgi:UDP-GlcNAc:undecaprenyl-phosphate GlcNAc-1-phosphate transferase